VFNLSKSKVRKILALAMISSMMLSIAACGQSKNTDSTSNTENTNNTETSSETKTETSEPESKEPVPIRWVRAGNEQDPTKDRILLELQKITNTKLDIVSIPWDQFPNKLNIMMATGEQIDIANCDPGKTLNSWAKDGLLLSYDELLKDGKHPLVASVINSELYKGFKIDGKSYYKPLPLVPQQWGYLIRQDWLDNVGLSMPKNLDDLYNVMKAFKEKDPDKNGKNDTYGWYGNAGGEEDVSGTFGFMNRAFAINAGAGSWVQQADGSITRYELSDAAKEAAKFARNVIKDGLINKDWLSVKQDAAQGPQSDAFASGKMGIVATSIPDVFVQKLKTVNPNAVVEYLPPVEGQNGVPANLGHTGGFWWGNVIPKTSKNPEKVLDLLEYSLTKEGRELTEFGIKDVHFTDKKEENNKIVYTVNKAECDKDWDTKKNGYLYPLTWGGLNYFEYAYIPIQEKNYNFDEAFKNLISMQPEDMATGKFSNWQVENSKYAIASPLMNIYDDNLLGDSKKLGSIWAQGWSKAVVGNGDFEKEWEAMKAKWLENGGVEIIKYGNELNKNMGN
jgi:putative aldouronate transport system substrate-binding protein